MIAANPPLEIYKSLIFETPFNSLGVSTPFMPQTYSLLFAARAAENAPARTFIIFSLPIASMKVGSATP
jgi:hypothetical protein